MQPCVSKFRLLPLAKGYEPEPSGGNLSAEDPHNLAPKPEQDSAQDHP